MLTAQTQELQPINKAMSLFDVQEKVFADIEAYRELQIVDSTTENDVRKARMVVRDLRYQVQNRQQEINYDLNQQKKDVKDYAELLISRIKSTESDLDGKIKAVESAREEKRLERERIEKEKADEIARIEADREAVRKKEAAIEARIKADTEKKYLSDWYDAIEINRIMIPDMAIQMNQEFDEERKEKLRADAERAKLISADIEKLNQAHDHVFKCWSKMVPVKKFDTQEGEAAFNEFKSIIGDTLSTFQTIIAGLA